MAERKGSLIAKSVSKHAGRAKEKILQNLGKVDRTADDIFDEHLENFTRQQQAASRLQKEFNNYIRCIRAVQGASKSLYDCLNDVYESGWVGQDVLYAQTQNIEMLWQDLSHKLADQVLLPLNTYYAQFPETKKKIDKRSRKLVDYDGQRHNMQSLEGGGGKKRDDAKISKAKEQLLLAKRTYDTLNSELHDELPALYHSRILFFVNNLQTLFSAEQVFHAETSKVYSELEAIIDKLAMETQKQSYTPRRVTNSPKSNNINTNSPGSPSSMTAEEASSEPSESPKDENSPETPAEEMDTTPTANEAKSKELSNCNDEEKSNKPEQEKLNETETKASPVDPVSTPTVNGNSIPSPTTTEANTEANNNRRLTDYELPPGATTDNLPPGVLYKVKATYRYNREDVDELSFEVGEVIRVIQYDDPEEQEDGWLMGVKESTGEKGMFPANFTRPL
ncbi:myc box-dependent-interacting protein 1 [Cimex lectularius]|uniref:Endophilin-A n=1 Tax=Cimex lectularius TaxID=79782 RepID=A0A8I6TD94_CIMLE|nr:myc box-dependent-interacting protein 1 [Cimex lectularius]